MKSTLTKVSSRSSSNGNGVKPPEAPDSSATSITGMESSAELAAPSTRAQRGESALTDAEIKEARLGVLNQCGTVPLSPQTNKTAVGNIGDIAELKEARLGVLRYCGTVEHDESQSSDFFGDLTKTKQEDTGTEEPRAYQGIRLQSLAKKSDDKKGEGKGRDPLLSATNTSNADDIPLEAPTLGRHSGHTTYSVPGAFSVSGALRTAPDNDVSYRVDEEMAIPDRDIPVVDHPPSPPSLCSGISDGLAVASLVDDHHSDASIQNAQEVESVHSAAEKSSFVWRKKGRLSLAVLCLASILTIVLVVVLRPDNTDEVILLPDTPPVSNHTEPPVDEPQTMDDYIFSLLPTTTLWQIRKQNSAQSNAFEWILQDPNVEGYSDHQILQRFALATYFFSTGGQITASGDISRTSVWYTADHWLSYDHHECDWFARNTSGIFEYPETSEHLMYNETGSVCDDDFNYIHLWHWSNGLRGRLPDELFLLTNLRSISLDRNVLQGTISSQIGKLQDLEALGLYSNEMTGTLPTELGRLDKIRFFWIMQNSIRGTIPSEIGMMTSLEYPIIDTLQLTGTIPSEVGNLSNLVWFWMSSNALTGSIPTEVGKLTTAEYLWLWNNQLSGPIPTEVGLMTSLETIAMDFNKFEGSIPSEIGVLEGLETLHVGSPFITGSIPTEFGNLDKLGSLVLFDTALTGTIPTEVGRMTSLWRFWTYKSHVSGTIPTEIGLMTGMWSLDLGYSNYTGTIPTILCSLTDLGQFRLWGNHLTGTLPTELGLLKGMTGDISFQENDFSGPIPSELGLLENMTTLLLHNNSLTSTVPVELSNLQQLRVLSISNNTLTGAIPSDVCGIASLWDEGAEGIRIDCDLVECTCDVCTCEGE